MTKASPKGGRGKGTRRSQRTKSGRRKESTLVRYLRQTWAELRKVRWPTRREAANLSVIVFSVTVGMSAFLGVVDWLSSLLFSFLIGATG